MEFKLGEPERGRTIFESILSNYPKRMDLWSVYVDMELRVGHVDVIRYGARCHGVVRGHVMAVPADRAGRHLFERITSMNLSSKKIKYFFKRYLDFEKQHGTAAQVEHVKQKARAYVESKMA